MKNGLAVVMLLLVAALLAGTNDLPPVEPRTAVTRPGRSAAVEIRPPTADRAASPKVPPPLTQAQTVALERAMLTTMISLTIYPGISSITCPIACSSLYAGIIILTTGFNTLRFIRKANDYSTSLI